MVRRSRSPEEPPTTLVPVAPDSPTVVVRTAGARRGRARSGWLRVAAPWAGFGLLAVAVVAATSAWAASLNAPAAPRPSPSAGSAEAALPGPISSAPPSAEALDDPSALPGDPDAGARAEALADSLKAADRSPVVVRGPLPTSRPPAPSVPRPSTAAPAPSSSQATTLPLPKPPVAPSEEPSCTGPRSKLPPGCIPEAGPPDGVSSGAAAPPQ